MYQDAASTMKGSVPQTNPDLMESRGLTEGGTDHPFLSPSLGPLMFPPEILCMALALYLLFHDPVSPWGCQK